MSPQPVVNAKYSDTRPSAPIIRKTTPSIRTRPNCPVQKAAEIIWDKWSLLILRNLFLDGPHRYQDLANALTGIGPTTLSKRLKSLQESGLILRAVLDGHPLGTRYELSETGQRVIPVLRAMRDFGQTLSD